MTPIGTDKPATARLEVGPENKRGTLKNVHENYSYYYLFIFIPRILTWDVEESVHTDEKVYTVSMCLARGSA